MMKDEIIIIDIECIKKNTHRDNNNNKKNEKNCIEKCIIFRIAFLTSIIMTITSHLRLSVDISDSSNNGPKMCNLPLISVTTCIIAVF